ncbi:hypothetical protein [Halospeciosus flavus]|uniref:Uncharacterized protein n=1 Tax=Halospeciosus flavus TaxID=3032283 RepID=A0ABD5Z0Q4_9EURY|nr:hypothetical protein [Halospeciosus flavus]
MTDTLELPNGDVVDTDDVFLFNDYPFQFVPLDHEEYAFLLSPLYWGDSGMDVPFEDREELASQWGPESEGRLTAEEWAAWLDHARDDDRFGDAELDTVATELPLPASSTTERDDESSLATRVRRTLGI